MGFVEWLTGAKPAQETQGSPVEQRSFDASFSISDADALAEYLGIGSTALAGVSVTERSSLGATAFYRCIAIVAGAIAGLPLKTYRKIEDDRERVASFLDNPAGPYPLTPYAWKELVMVHMLIRGETFLRHIYNQGGALIGLLPIHPSAVSVKWNGSDKDFRVEMADGSHEDFTTDNMTQVMGLSTDGLRGISPLTIFRNAIGTGIAGDHAAARTFGSGLLLSGIVTPDEDIEEGDAKIIKEGLQAKVAGVEHAGDIAVVNRKLNFSPWSMTNEDAQFIQSREFQVVEFARMFGVPPHLLGATEKQTSWGTGVAEQNLGLARYTLMPWTSRLEESLSALLPQPRFCEFDYKGLLQGTPKDEIDLLKTQLDAGILTKDEARAILNRPPLTAAQKAEMAPAPIQPADEGSAPNGK